MHTGTYENDNTDLYRDNNSNLVLSFRSILCSKPLSDNRLLIYAKRGFV